jgi:hypothetical protein
LTINKTGPGTLTTSTITAATLSIDGKLTIAPGSGTSVLGDLIFDSPEAAFAGDIAGAAPRTSQLSAVPEPQAAALLVVGAATAACAFRKRLRRFLRTLLPH